MTIGGNSDNGEQMITHSFTTFVFFFCYVHSYDIVYCYHIWRQSKSKQRNVSFVCLDLNRVSIVSSNAIALWSLHKSL